MKLILNSQSSNVVALTLPREYLGRRFGISYCRVGRKFEIMPSEEGVVAGKMASKVSCRLTFSKDRWAPSMPKGRWELDVASLNKGVELALPAEQTPRGEVQKPARQVKVNGKRLSGPGRRQAKAAVTYLNKFAQEHGFDLEVVGNKLSLSKVERI